MASSGTPTGGAAAAGLSPGRTPRSTMSDHDVFRIAAEPRTWWGSSVTIRDQRAPPDATVATLEKRMTS